MLAPLTRPSCRAFSVAFPSLTDDTKTEAAPSGAAPDAEKEAAAAASPEEADAAPAEPVEPAQDPAAEIEELKKKVQVTSDARLRALAELENVRRIAERDVDTAKTYAIQKFAKQLLDVSDNLERALSQVPEGKTGEDLTDEEAAAVGRAIIGGVRATSKEMTKVFELNGITAFGEAGEKFDANTMEAMYVVPITDELPAGTVGQLLMRGYKFKERVLRPAQVGATPIQ